ncbi:MAG: hypothetical protein E6Q75_06985 [Rheinheimera sp.]|nr:MAG: hypothetical protein E6Q75_06985 [Rheinheimera sp.]
MMNLMTDEQDRKVRMAAVKIFSNLCTEWSILPEQSPGLLGFADVEELFAWQNGELDRVNNDKALEMLSHLMAIYKLLHQIFANQKQANAWLLKSNSGFNGDSALNVIQENGLNGGSVVRRYLEQQLG